MALTEKRYEQPCRMARRVVPGMLCARRLLPFGAVPEKAGRAGSPPRCAGLASLPVPDL